MGRFVTTVRGDVEVEGETHLRGRVKIENDVVLPDGENLAEMLQDIKGRLAAVETR